MPSPEQKWRKPRLERRNALKNIDYDASSYRSSSSDESSLMTDIFTSTSQRSFRIDGVDGEFDRICRSLGFSGPEDFAIPVAAWEESKARSSRDWLSKKPPSQPPDSPPNVDGNKGELDDSRDKQGLVAGFGNGASTAEDIRGPSTTTRQDNLDSLHDRLCYEFWGSRSSRGIKGIRPPVLAAPSISLPIPDTVFSRPDLSKSFAPREDQAVVSEICGEAAESEVAEETNRKEDSRMETGLVATELTHSCSFSPSNGAVSSNRITATMNIISPNGKFKRTIHSWERGSLLGSGSFGRVYDGISDDGFFFAVKEVSLLDQGNRAHECILQLEQEIALLSQFEHENIVQYLGTDKEEAKLFIFLELVTQGSLASLYQRFHLRDSQVSVYTRQILNGLKFLHDRNVIHRDIKCANILVDASGLVKLADFGLAKETSKLNMLKSCKGSAYWMAPEVVNPRKSYGLEADIWSLGCTVLEMLTRQLPYSNLEWPQALFRIGRGEPPPIPEYLSRDAQDFIQQCLRVDPYERPSPSELLDHPFVRKPFTSCSVPVSPHNGNTQSFSPAFTTEPNASCS